MIKNGRVIDPASNRDQTGDLYIDNGVISEPFANGCDLTIDADGMWVAPGFIDLHTHMREPGFERKEDIAHGALAALAGGFTTVCCMPNTDPVADCAEIIDFIKTKSSDAKGADVLPFACVTKGMRGMDLCDFGELAKAGAYGFSDDGKPVANPALLLEAVRKTAVYERTVFSHCEDKDLGTDAISESVSVARDLLLAKNAGARIHICHISASESAVQLRLAKSTGVKATGETCPHYFALTRAAIPPEKEASGNYKMNPPLRDPEDVRAIKDALADGTIDAIATDHAPHHADEKNCGYEMAANGVIGLETALGVCVTQLVNTGVLTPSGLIAKLTVNPAKILGINKGTLACGADADVVIIDPVSLYAVDSSKFFSKGRNTPFEGMILTGRVMKTIKGGVAAYEAH